MSRACILLVNWNGWGDTIECLESIFRSVEPDVRVIVCDNNSDNGSVERIKSWAEGRLDVVVPVIQPLRERSWPPVPKPVLFKVYDRSEAEKGGDHNSAARLILIRTGGNLGFAGGNNVGLRYVLAQDREDYVWLLNNDTVIAPGALEALLARMNESPTVGMCGSTLLNYAMPQRVQARGGGWYCKWIGLPWHIGQMGKAGDAADADRVERYMNYVVGASIGVSRAFLTQVGLMCEDYFLFFEETDWALRAKGLFHLAYAPGSIVYHKIGQSIGTSSVPSRKSYTCDYYSLRNRLLFTRRYYPHLVPLICLSLLCALFVRAFCGRWDRVTLIWRLLTGFDRSAVPVKKVRE
jgi:GT2 family glycosyltransferase